MNPNRIRTLKEAPIGSGPVIYWMSRDQRAHDNWALVYAQELALKQKTPIAVVFCLVPEFLGATIRQYGFMLKGLAELGKELRKFQIPFFLLTGQPELEVPQFVGRHHASALITDFSPLRISRAWKTRVSAKINVPFYEVDAHNIVPCWAASSKQEFAARTFRPKIRRLLPEYLDHFPKLKRHPHRWKEEVQAIDWKGADNTLRANRTVAELDWIRPGERVALQTLRDFLKKCLAEYEPDRNDPTKDVQSNLSPYLHFGHISAQRIALEAEKHKGDLKSKAAFLEQLIVRRELSDNFCFYNPHYDSFEGFPNWAKKTLNERRRDARPHVYSLKQFEKAKTHDDLWNAAQMEMVKTGKMHGYMRMYWVKKILEWSRSPEEAMDIAIFLNDKYELDGRDPNGYVGIAWSIGGVHDRPWFERKIYGQVRYMSAGGCEGKFNVKRYIASNLP